MNQTGVIYMYTSPSNKKYVGQTIRLNKRIEQHINSSRDKNDTSYDYAFHRAIRKYGYDNMKFEIQESNIPREQLDEREMYWIKRMDSFGPNGYNMNAGGRGNKGRKFTEEQKRRISLMKKGQGLGHTVSEETRRKISEKNKGKSHPRSEETRRKISEHNARAVAKKVTFGNSGIFHDKEYYPGLIFDTVTACAQYFGVAVSTMSSIKAGKYNKQSNMKIVEIAQ